MIYLKGTKTNICFARIESTCFLLTVVSKPLNQKILFSPNQTMKFISDVDKRIIIETECRTYKNNIWANLEV